MGLGAGVSRVSLVEVGSRKKSRAPIRDGVCGGGVLRRRREELDGRRRGGVCLHETRHKLTMN